MIKLIESINETLKEVFDGVIDQYNLSNTLKDDEELDDEEI